MLALDYLRGYFILVIIIDHLYRWPSALALLTGQGYLWFNAADGFVIVSGLMIGYVRGYKGLKLSYWDVTKKLWSRAFLLYIWLITSTLIYTTLAWLNPSLQGLPYVPIANGAWLDLAWQAVTMQFSYVWINFLYLYAIFLVIAPAAVWLLRKRLAWVIVALSLIGLLIGDMTNIKWLQWQPLFFIPSVAGFYLESIQSWWNSKKATKKIIPTAIYSLTFILLGASVLTTFILSSNPTIDAVNLYFNKEHIELGGVIVSLITFCGFVLFFIQHESFIQKWLGWLLHPFGVNSLTAYILHGIVIIFIAATIPISQSIILNTLAGIFAVGATLLLLKVPFITKILPR